MRRFIVDGYPVKLYGYNDRKLPNGSGYRDLKVYLVEKYGVCFHCGVKVVIWPHQDGGTPPPNNATIDHLKPKPYRKKHEVAEKVLSCLRCNSWLSNKPRVYPVDNPTRK